MAGSRKTFHTIAGAPPTNQSSTSAVFGPYQDPAALVAAEDGVGRLPLDAGHLGGGQCEVAAAATAAGLEPGRGDATELHPELVVERGELVRKAGRGFAPEVLDRLELAVDLGLGLGDGGPQLRAG